MRVNIEMFNSGKFGTLWKGSFEVIRVNDQHDKIMTKECKRSMKLSIKHVYREAGYGKTHFHSSRES